MLYVLKKRLNSRLAGVGMYDQATIDKLRPNSNSLQLIIAATVVRWPKCPPSSSFLRRNLLFGVSCVYLSPSPSPDGLLELSTHTLTVSERPVQPAF